MPIGSTTGEGMNQNQLMQGDARRQKMMQERQMRQAALQRAYTTPQMVQQTVEQPKMMSVNPQMAKQTAIEPTKNAGQFPVQQQAPDLQAQMMAQAQQTRSGPLAPMDPRTMQQTEQMKMQQAQNMGNTTGEGMNNYQLQQNALRRQRAMQEAQRRQYLQQMYQYQNQGA